ncbi:MAG: hypothetical protein ACK4VP_01230 [Nitrospira sp.]
MVARSEGRDGLCYHANDLSSFPSALLRKGRFDNIFFVDLPDDEREAIWKIHLRLRKQDPAQLDMVTLSVQQRFQRTEIEPVVASLYRYSPSTDPDCAEGPLSLTDHHPFPQKPSLLFVAVPSLRLIPYSPPQNNR